MLKPLRQAIADGDVIHAVIKGSAVNHGGYTPSITAPSTELEAEVVMKAWRDALAESVGVNTRRYRTLAFVVASFFVGIAGALFAHYLGTINPHQFGVGILVFVLVWVIVGGTKTFAGPIIGVTVLSVLNELFRGTDELRPAIYGCILIASIMFLPDGLESVPGKIRGAIHRWRNVGNVEGADL